MTVADWLGDVIELIEDREKKFAEKMAKSSLNGKRANEKSSTNGQAQVQDANGSLNTSNSSSSNSDGVIRVGSSFQVSSVIPWETKKMGYRGGPHMIAIIFIIGIK